MSARRKISLYLRRAVIERASGRCEYCRSPETFSLDTFTVDHVQPVAAEGSDDLDNLAYACHNCNNRKQDTMTAPDPETGERVPLYHPRRDQWRDHFSWSSDYLTVQALTATGRATI